jgi:hypothetical protein
MTIGKYLTGGAWAAMAAALAFTSMPASAQREARGWNNGQSERADRASRRDGPRGEERRPQRSQPAPREDRGGSQVREVRVPPSSAPSAPRGDVQAQAPNWGSGNARADRAPQQAASRGGWNRGNAPAVRPQPDRSYADANRNRTYDGRRDGNRQDSRRDDGRNWDGNRSGDGRTWDGNRRGDNDRNWNDGRRNSDRNWNDSRRGNDNNWANRNSGYRDGYRDAQRDYRRWDNRGWRNDRRYNWYQYRAANRHVYRLSPYYAPYRNYYYRRLSIGIFLDSLFYSNRYWINDPWHYRLPAVYGPYRWVRYYDDALLVDIYTGEVVDVIHDFFW